MITADDAATFERCMHVGGVAVFPSDTVYGLACDVGDERAVRRLYALKKRDPDVPAAVMFFSLDLALESLGPQGPQTIAALRALLPGPVAALLPNPDGRYPLACGPSPDTLGLRVPALPEPARALGAVRWPILQSSANVSGGPDCARVGDIPESIRAGADLVLDAGELPGTASTVLDLRAFEAERSWSIVREGALGAGEIAARLA